MVTKVPWPAVSPGSRDGASVTLGGFSGCYHTALGLRACGTSLRRAPSLGPLVSALCRSWHAPRVSLAAHVEETSFQHICSRPSAQPPLRHSCSPLLKPGMCPPAQRLVRGQSEPVSPVFRLFRAETEKLQALFPPTLFNLRTLGDQISVGVTNGSGFTAVGILRSECGGSQSPGMKYCIKNNKD